MKKVLVLGDTSYSSLFKNKGFELVDNINGVDLIVFTGGTDLDPHYYGEKRGFQTSIPDVRRDQREFDIFNQAVMNDIPMVGICRGSQALCAWSGGKLVQHVENHCQYHNILTEDGRELVVSSTHHQMMYPWDIEHKLLGYSIFRSGTYLNGDNEEIEFSERGFDERGIMEPEVVYFPETNALSHQPHPEFMQKGSPYVDYFWETIEQYLGVKV